MRNDDITDFCHTTASLTTNFLFFSLFFLILTSAYGHVAAPGAVLGAGPDGGAVLLHPVARLALEADVLADGEVFPVAEAIGGHGRVPAVYHCRWGVGRWGVEEVSAPPETCVRFVFLRHFSVSSPQKMIYERWRADELASVRLPNGRNASRSFPPYYLPC